MFGSHALAFLSTLDGSTDYSEITPIADAFCVASGYQPSQGMGSAAWSDELAAIAGGSTWQAFIAEVSAKMDAAWLQDAPTPDVLGLWVAHRKAKLIGG